MVGAGVACTQHWPRACAALRCKHGCVPWSPLLHPACARRQSDVESLLAQMDRLQTGYQVRVAHVCGALWASRSRAHVRESWALRAAPQVELRGGGSGAGPCRS